MYLIHIIEKDSSDEVVYSYEGPAPRMGEGITNATSGPEPKCWQVTGVVYHVGDGKVRSIYVTVERW